MHQRDRRWIAGTKRGQSGRLAPAFLWVTLGICCVLPLAWMVGQMLGRPQMLQMLWPTSFRAALLGRTLLYNGIAALLATGMAIPAAVVVGRGRGVVAGTLVFLLPLGVMMPSVAYTYGWVQAFRLAGIVPEPAGVGDVMRCIWTLACWLWALPAIAIGLSLRYLDSHVQQQALLEGALWRLTARQLAGPAAAATAMVLVLAIQEFGVYERTGISVIATEVRTIFETGAFGSSTNPIAGVAAGSGAMGPGQEERAGAAVAAALPMLLLVLLLAGLAFWGMGRLAAAERVEMNDWPRALNAGWMPKLATALLIAITLGLPVAAMLLSIASYRWHVDASGHVMPTRVWLWAGDYVLGSLLVASIGGTVALGIAAAACMRRSAVLLAISLLTFLIGGELLAIADIRIYNRPPLWPFSAARIHGHDLFELIYNNVPVMVIAYVGRFGWLGLLAGAATWSRPFQELREMSAVDGADRWRVVAAVIWPVAWPMLVASSVLVMILSMTEVGATVLISPQRPQMLVPLLMGWVHMQRYDEMLEGTLLLVAMVLVLGVAFVLLTWMGIHLMGALRKSAVRQVMFAAALLVVINGCGDGRKPEAVWFETGGGRGQTVYPRGIAYSRRDDCFFLVDRMARIQRIEHDGEVTADWRMPDYARGKPVGLTVGPDGNLYVPDTHYARVMVYSPTGEFLKKWGTEGRALGQFTYPTDVAFDAQGNIYVSEYGDNDRIQVFDPTGTSVLRVIGQFGDGDGQFARPQSMVIDHDLIYVTDACNHRIVVFRTDGMFVRNIGGVGSGLGQFKFPYGLDEDLEGHLVVTEFGNNRVQVIDKETGRGLATWGLAGREPGQLAYPWAAAVDKRDRIVVVDSGNNRLQVFR